MTEDTKAWIAKADADLRMVSIALREGEYDISCFHSQQAGEKYLKSILCQLDEDIPRTHDLVRLKMILLEIHVGIPNSLEVPCEILTRYAITTRYPGITLPISEAQRGLECALEVEKFVKSYISMHC